MMDDQSTNIISKLSIAFVRKFRVTILAFVAIILLGFFSYTQFLDREGFPDVVFPLAFVQTPYFVDDIETVNSDITIPIEESLKDVEGVLEVQSNTGPNFSFLVVMFEEKYTSEEGVDLIESEFDKSLELPEGIEAEVKSLKPSYDGVHDFLLSIYPDDGKLVDPSELENKAGEVAGRLEKLPVSKKATAINLFTSGFDPATSEEFEYQSTFNRVGIKEDGGLEFFDSILVGVVKKDSTNTIELSDTIREEIDEIKETSDLLDGYEVVYSGDFAVDLNNQIDSLESNALSALIAVIVVLLLFVNWRASIVTAVFIPTVMAATFVGLYLIGYSLNIISLFALILVLGLFVDDAIVVVETIDYNKRQGKKGIEAIAAGIKSISVADVAGTVTTIIVFVPMAAITGILGEFISPIPITVILALVLSLIIALTLIPFFSYVLIPDQKDKKSTGQVYALIDILVNGFNRGVMKVGDSVSKFVNLYLSRWYLTLAVIIISFILIGMGIFASSELKFSIFPPMKDSNGISINITYTDAKDIEQKQAIAEQVENVINVKYRDMVEAVNYYFVGRNDFGADQALMQVNLVPMEEREKTSVKIAEELRKSYEGLVDGARVQVAEAQTGPPVEEFQFFMQIYSENPETRLSAASVFKSYIQELELDDNSITNVKIKDDGALTKLDGRQYVEIGASLSDPYDSQAIQNLEKTISDEYDNKETLRELGLEPDSLGFDQGMESDNQEAFESAIFALYFALIVMYALLVLQFNSLLQPLLIFIAIPFSFPGLFPGLYATDNAMSFFVLLGIIALVGIVVNNTIMLLDFTKQERQQGNGIVDAIVNAVKIRFRPLVTTSVTTVVGLTPLALSDPLWESLSFTIIFGLISSTAMVIFVFPAYYVIIERIRQLKYLVLNIKR